MAFRQPTVPALQRGPGSPRLRMDQEDCFLQRSLLFYQEVHFRPRPCPKAPSSALVRRKEAWHVKTGGVTRRWVDSPRTEKRRNCKECSTICRLPWLY